MGIAPQALLDQQRQALHPPPHISVAHRGPHPRAWRDHRIAFSAAATCPGDAEPRRK